MRGERLEKTFGKILNGERLQKIFKENVQFYNFSSFKGKFLGLVSILGLLYQ